MTYDGQVKHGRQGAMTDLGGPMSCVCMHMWYILRFWGRFARPLGFCGAQESALTRTVARSWPEVIQDDLVNQRDSFRVMWCIECPEMCSSCVWALTNTWLQRVLQALPAETTVDGLPRVPSGAKHSPLALAFAVWEIPFSGGSLDKTWSSTSEYFLAL